MRKLGTIITILLLSTLYLSAQETPRVELFGGYAIARIDDTLHFGVESIHVREIVKFTGYQRTAPTQTASRP